MKSNANVVLRICRAVTAVVALAVVLSLGVKGVRGVVLNYSVFFLLTVFAGYNFETLSVRLPKLYTLHCVCLTLALTIFMSYIMPSHQRLNMDGLSIVNAVILAPIFEEFFFRGALVSFSKAPLTMIISSLIFGSFHGPDAFLQTFLMGLIFSYFYISSGNIAVPILCHMSNNLLAVITRRSDIRIPAFVITVIIAIVIYKFGAKNEKKIL